MTQWSLEQYHVRFYFLKEKKGLVLWPLDK